MCFLVANQITEEVKINSWKHKKDKEALIFCQQNNWAPSYEGYFCPIGTIINFCKTRD